MKRQVCLLITTKDIFVKDSNRKKYQKYDLACFDRKVLSVDQVKEWVQNKDWDITNIIEIKN